MNSGKWSILDVFGLKSEENEKVKKTSHEITPDGITPEMVTPSLEDSRGGKYYI